MREWLETDGLGGFSSGTESGVRTRRSHALLAVATPDGRFVLVNGLDAWLETDAASFPLSSQAYVPDILHPDGAQRTISFEADPWPRWTYRCEDGSTVEHELLVPNRAGVVLLTWRLIGKRPDQAMLHVRPFLSGREPDAPHRENSAFRFAHTRSGPAVTFNPYPDIPGVHALSNGSYGHAPNWYRKFVYEEDRARGDEFSEDLASPGVFAFDLLRGEAILILRADSTAGDQPLDPAAATVNSLRASERRRRGKSPRIDRASDGYIVDGSNGKNIVAGYPWLTDRARDTFIAIRGLALAVGKLDAARAILVAWAATISDGMLPDRFPSGEDEREYTSVDASLWYVIAIHEYFEAMNAARAQVPPADRATLEAAVESILNAYAAGTRGGILVDADGLLAAGQPGLALTWMNARAGDFAITPRIGKPVEVQALWLSALRVGCETSVRWMDLLERGLSTFHARFWNEHGDCLHDVIDVNHVRGTRDATFRINQIFAVGGLPFPLLTGERARRVVDEVERRLMTQYGPRTLGPGEPGYTSRDQADPQERDRRRHQGNVWPWLTGAFVEGWVRVRGGSAAARREARARFLDPLLRGLDTAGIGHLFEHADATWPHTPRGCPFFACSVGEALRLDHVVLGGRNVTRWPRRRLALRRKSGRSVEV